MLRPVLKLPGVERLRILAHPLVALPVWALNLYVWHIPFLYDGALHHDAVHALEHFMLLHVRLPDVDARARDAPERRRGSAPARSSGTSSSSA